MRIWHALDTETTGLSPNQGAEVAEMALITCVGSEIVDVYHDFYAVRGISQQAAAVNGLTLAQLQGWKSFGCLENLNKVKSLIKGPIFAHNARFDMAFMHYYGILPPDYPSYCTKELCKKANLPIPNNKLISLLEYLRIPHRPHGALSDAFGLTKAILTMGWQVNIR
jgi:DNA polymerase III epsilon subunit-like protein